MASKEIRGSRQGGAESGWRGHTCRSTIGAESGWHGHTCRSTIGAKSGWHGHTCRSNIVRPPSFVRPQRSSQRISERRSQRPSHPASTHVTSRHPTSPYAPGSDGSAVYVPAQPVSLPTLPVNSLQHPRHPFPLLPARPHGQQRRRSRYESMMGNEGPSTWMNQWEREESANIISGVLT